MRTETQHDYYPSELSNRNIRMIYAGDYIYQRQSGYYTPLDHLEGLGFYVSTRIRENEQIQGIVILSYKEGYEPHEKPFDFEYDGVIDNKHQFRLLVA